MATKRFRWGIPAVTLAGALLLVLAFIPLTGLARADNGDGTEACVTGEICLYDLSWSSRYTKHFWWSESDYAGSGYRWWDTVYHYRTSSKIDDDMSAVVNKDTQCAVVFQNYDTYPFEEWIADNIWYWQVAPNWMDQKADGHWRCP